MVIVGAVFFGDSPGDRPNGEPLPYLQLMPEKCDVAVDLVRQTARRLLLKRRGQIIVRDEGRAVFLAKLQEKLPFCFIENGFPFGSG